VNNIDDYVVVYLEFERYMYGQIKNQVREASREGAIEVVTLVLWGRKNGAKRARNNNQAGARGRREFTTPKTSDFWKEPTSALPNQAARRLSLLLSTRIIIFTVQPLTTTYHSPIASSRAF
jgi:hypothetical protein